MAKAKKQESFYDKAVKNRVLIMLIILFILTPILFLTGLLTVTYKDNKPNPFSEIQYKTTSLKYINNNIIEINDIYLKEWKVETNTEGNKYEFKEDATMRMEYKIGKKVEDSPLSANLTIKTYLCYNWANIQTSASSTTFTRFNENRVGNTVTFDATFDKRPFFFTSVNIEKDARFLTSFSWSQTVDGESKTITYVVEQSFKDVYRSGQTQL